MKEELKIFLLIMLLLTCVSVYLMFDWMHARGQENSLIMMGIPTVSSSDETVSLTVRNMGDRWVLLSNASLTVDGVDFWAKSISC
ncbi:MAG: hypothetical protein QFX35_04365 [Candidatus Verstraetearchaeota archaeon]|nr:hypothetical protein [Candidatus Verstraetearchaeota archaeon]